ncbi:sulfate ABC transporter substrate-binding protein [candidate division KSB1 bacterium]|nr:sulfate ABC transporter substrate-binding protein [candidate division KSB1 bacterium]
MLRKWMFVLLVGLNLAGCGKNQEVLETNEVTLTLGAYTVPKEAYQKEIIPAFQKFWFEKTGEQVKFEESYIASGAQSRAIEAGFEADIAALSLEDDINRLQKANLITHDWKKLPYNGFVTQSVVVIAFRRGNPKNIRNWEDLTRTDVSVLYPSPKTSGGAMWDINAIYGAGLKMSEITSGQPDKQAARNLLKAIQKNVKVMDKSGRASVTTFENGIGDALLTYENEIILRLFEGRDVEYTVPDATILIENPIALIDRHVDKHNTRQVAEAFIKFVFEKESQRAFAKYGFRPVDPEVATEFSAQYPTPQHLFNINYLGGWEKVIPEIFGENGVWTQITEELGNEK